MSLIIQNFLLFQAGWLVCVIGGASERYAWAGMVVVSVIIALHLARANALAREAKLIAITMVIGTAWDSMLFTAGLFVFSNGVFLQGMIPHWMIAMWALFATTLNVSLRWMKGRLLIATAFGAIGGPIAYYAGHRLGAVEFGNTLYALLATGVGWALIMPALVLISERQNGYENKPELYEVKTA